MEPPVRPVAEERERIAVRTLDVGGAEIEPVFSRPRHAFPNASLNVRPIAITSPTDFIVDVSAASASGNFSKAKRGTLITT